MSLRLPPVETNPLVIRDFQTDDLNVVHRILDLEIDLEPGLSIEDRRRWLEWSIMSYQELAGLYQPPYGERAVTLGDTTLTKQPLRALQENPSGSFWQRTRDSVALWFE